MALTKAQVTERIEKANQLYQEDAKSNEREIDNLMDAVIRHYEAKANKSKRLYPSIILWDATKTMPPCYAIGHLSEQAESMSYYEWIRDQDERGEQELVGYVDSYVYPTAKPVRKRKPKANLTQA